jgi:2-methylcitrate dehydratase PrpD
VKEDAISPVMRKLSGYIASAPRRPLPAEVVERTKHHILDTIAAMVSGSRLLPGRKAISYVETLGGTKEACVIGSRIVTSAANAALANGMCAHADETDDSHAPSVMHPGCGIVPAALAVAEKERRNGEALLRAVALGYDVATRLTMSLNAFRFREEGLSTHSYGPTFGAAAAAGLLVGLKEREVRYLLSYAAQQASGISCWMRDEEHIEKAFDFGGMPARNGVTAATMVAQGFSGVEDVFSGERNFFVAHGRPANPGEMVPGRGLRNPAHQHQALVGRLADPGAARLAGDSHCGAWHHGGAGREAHDPCRPPGQEHHRRAPHARHQHAAPVRGDADGRHGDLQVLAR